MKKEEIRELAKKNIEDLFNVSINDIEVKHLESYETYYFNNFKR